MMTSRHITAAEVRHQQRERGRVREREINREREREQKVSPEEKPEIVSQAQRSIHLEQKFSKNY